MDTLRISPKLAGPVAAPAASLQRILVVDDLPEICMIFKDVHRRIRHLNVEIHTETNSKRAQELAQTQAFDLVVSDFRMKQVDGIEVLKAANERNPKGRRVLMTGYNEVPTSLDRIREARVDAYVQKPLHAQEILLLLLGMLQNDAAFIEERRRHARELESQPDASLTPVG